MIRFVCHLRHLFWGGLWEDMGKLLQECEKRGINGHFRGIIRRKRGKNGYFSGISS
jgi:hypothetical protein